MNERKDSVTLKWGTLKAWHFETKECQDLMSRYIELGVSLGAMTQKDTHEQKEIICEIIDKCDAEEIYLDWDGEWVSKTDAKKYVMEYGQED